MQCAPPHAFSKEAITIVTLPNGAVIPDPGARIPANGVQPTITLGASVDAQLGLVKNTTSTGITKAQQAADHASERALVADQSSQARDQALADGIAAMEGMTYAGPWDPDRTYRINDVVTYGGDSWARLTAGSEGEPGDPQHWGLVARKGDGAGFGDLIETDITGLYESQTPPIPSSYEVAVQQGYQGTAEQWLDSLVGPRGPEGPYGGTEVTDPQVASYVTTDTETRSALEAAYRRSVSVREYGATGDGQADDTAAVQAALTENPGANIYFPPGHYRLTGNLAVPAGTTVSGADSASTLLDWSGKGSFGGFLLEWGKGALTDSVPLTADTAFGDGTVTVETGHGFAVGDYVRITADEVLYGEMVKGEFQRVLAVDGETLELSSQMFDSYTTALSGRVEKAHLVTGGLRGVTVRGQGVNPDGYGDAVARFALARDVQVSDVRFEDVEHKCIQLDSVLGAVITDCHFRFDTSRTPLQYGVAIQGASQMVTVSDCSSWNDRHMVTTATSQSLAEHSTENRGIPRIITITGCTAHGSWQAPIDTHRGGEYVTVTGCALTTESTGIKFRGKQSIAVGNTIVGKQASITGAPYGVRLGMLCEDVQITGNLIRGFENGVRIDTPDGATRGIVISENNILDCAQPVGIHGTTVVTGIRVAGNLLRAIAGGYPVYVIAAVDDLEIVNNTMDGGHTGIFMAHPTRPIHRLMVQGNTMRGQSTRGTFLRNVTDGFVTGNLSARPVRFSGAHTRVTAALNAATVEDLSDDGISQPLPI